MYTSHKASPKKFGSHTSSFKTPARRSFGGTSRFGGERKPVRVGGFNSAQPSFKRGGGHRQGGASKKRFRGDRIDFSRFIKKAEHVAEKAYLPKYNFSDFPFSPELHKNIARAGYISPRPIQDQAIPTLLEGRDVFGMANTGTGKTAAFLLPLIDKISKTKGQNKKETVLIMAPTRELALQIEADFKKLAFGFGMFSVACVGGLPIMKQIREIQMGVSFVIGTPGRLRDLIDKKVLDLSTCHSVVLDEAARMRDMGFRDDLS